MLKLIYKMLTKNYNDIESIENTYEICEPGNPYGHVKEFIKLSEEVKRNAHRVISKEAVLMYANNIEFGTAIDINGNIYYFDIFEDGDYRVSKIKKYEENIKEVADERYFKKNS